MQSRLLVKRIFARMGYEVRRIPSNGPSHQDPVEATEADELIWRHVQPYTMADRMRTMALIRSVRYVVENDIPGDFVECGVWRGGSSMAIALTLKDMRIEDRDIWLYDTFDGMTDPSTLDVESGTGATASSLLASANRLTAEDYRCQASLEDVQANMGATHYPKQHLRLIRGDVSTTLAQVLPESIALLRLDTDWYDSTLVELTTLYPRLSPAGVCIVDDYGHWQGARKAVDEYFSCHAPKPLLNRVDYTCRLIIKTSRSA
jgi:O-methyltransferase